MVFSSSLNRKARRPTVRVERMEVTVKVKQGDTYGYPFLVGARFRTEEGCVCLTVFCTSPGSPTHETSRRHALQCVWDLSIDLECVRLRYTFHNDCEPDYNEVPRTVIRSLVVVQKALQPLGNRSTTRF